MKHHMLIIGMGQEIHQKIDKMGVKISLIVSKEMLKKIINPEFYHRIVLLPKNATQKEWIATAKFINSLEAIDSIGGFSEPFQEMAACISKELNLFYPSLKTIDLTKNKKKMRLFLKKHKLDDTHSSIVQTNKQISDFSRRHGFPLVLKPIDGRGSMGVSIIKNKREISMAVERINKHSLAKTMLVEEFLVGSEWSVECFSEDGVHIPVCVTQKFKDPIHCIETGHSLPAKISIKLKNEIEDTVKKILTAIGLQNGPSHTEIIVTQRGPRIVETHTRLAGDSIVDMIRFLSRVDLDELWIRQQMGEKVIHMVPHNLKKHAAISFVSPHKNGMLKRIEGVERASSLTGVVKTEVLLKAGAKINGVLDSFSRGAYAIALASTPQKAYQRALEATRKIQFRVEAR